MSGLRLVVIGDSFTFVDDRGPQLPDADVLWPNVLGRELADALGRPVETTVLARPGWGVRDVWEALTKDRHVQFGVVARADAVVLAIGSYDHVPAGVPAVVDQIVPHVRPARVRRLVRRSVRRANPVLIRLTRGRLRRTPAAEFARLYDLVLTQLRGLTHGVPTVVLGPAGHRSAYYAHRNPHLADGERLQRESARAQGIPAVACWELVEPRIDALNVDGIHWPPDVHAAVARALAGPLIAQLEGTRPAPPDPWEALSLGDA